jgi:hypothetical protein
MAQPQDHATNAPAEDEITEEMAMSMIDDA